WLWRRFHFSFAVFSALRFVLAGGLLLVPTALMGATLPALADYLAGVRSRRLAPEWLYTVNLVGAALGVVAAGFVLMPAVGVAGAWGSRRGRHVTDVRPELGKMHLLMAICLLDAVALTDRLPYWYADLWEAWRPAGLAGLVAMNTSAVFALLFLPALFAGTILPLVLVGAVSGDHHRTGPLVGRLYAVNTVGAIVGAVFTGFVAIPRFGSQTTLLAIAVA